MKYSDAKLTAKEAGTSALALFVFLWAGGLLSSSRVCAFQEVQSHKFKSPIISLEVSSDQKKTFVGSGGSVQVFDSNLKRLAEIKSEMDFVCAILSDNNRLYLAGGDPAEHGMIEAYEVLGDREFRLIKRKIRHEDVIHSIAKCAIGQLVTASADSRINRSDPQSLALSGTYQRHSKRVTVAEPIVGTDLIISGGLDDTLKVWSSLENTKPVKTLTHHQGDILGIKCKLPDPDDSSSTSPMSTMPMVVSVSRDRTVRFWQPTIGRLVRFKKLDQIPTSVCWIPKSDKVLVGCDDGQVIEISSQTLKMRKVAEVGQRIFCIHMLGSSEILVGGQTQLFRKKLPSTN